MAFTLPSSFPIHNGIWGEKQATIKQRGCWRVGCGEEVRTSNILFLLCPSPLSYFVANEIASSSFFHSGVIIVIYSCVQRKVMPERGGMVCDWFVGRRRNGSGLTSFPFWEIRAHRQFFEQSREATYFWLFLFGFVLVFLAVSSCAGEAVSSRGSIFNGRWLTLRVSNWVSSKRLSPKLFFKVIFLIFSSSSAIVPQSRGH